MPKIFLILLSLFLTSCGSLKESPVIYFSNSSPEAVKNIQCVWVKNVLSLPVLTPGDSRSQSFYIKRPDDFFGLINVSWYNAKNEKVVKEFYFREKNMPSFSDPTTYNYVQIYFDQEELEIVSSDSPDLSGKTSKMDRILNHYREAYSSGHTVPQTSLISVQPKKDTSVPNWMINSY